MKPTAAQAHSWLCQVVQDKECALRSALPATTGAPEQCHLHISGKLYELQTINIKQEKSYAVRRLKR